MVDSVCKRCRHALTAARNGNHVRTQADDDMADALAWIIVMDFTRFAMTKDDADFEWHTQTLTHIRTAAAFVDLNNQDT